ncbi:MAG: PLP-dependent aminotransferase family protein [Chloroflexi bacterium]|nr:PLP-dependent aminotransferase family protein [Chloroflexota bacterium]MCI0576384.1 PLP-dependent aminotransferase family protein [Chloroflexota bacterium]MCI0643867.1 PLP-dependent aminotransferase family protein [Chloroflexota bacterium]MCI0730592.1 PLP-dependent aminotransferase family protein [Chloroflexota bacterium]
MSIFRDDLFSPAQDTPLYQQLYSHLQAAILSGELKGGLKLPSTRVLAGELGVSRNTILNAYEQLAAEGYLESVEGSGTFVARVLPDLLFTTPGRKVPRQPRRTGPDQPRFSDHARLQLAAPLMAALRPSGNELPRPFRFGMPAVDAFPYQLWSRLVVRQARRLPASALTYQDPAGYGPLREAIAAHVTVSRRVHCTPEQIVIVSGSQGALDLASRMLINPGDPVWLEDPGYLSARGAFLGAGAHIVPVPIDEEGLVVEAGIARAPQARLVYITPSHQFPLGVTMSLARRLALLDWARRAGATILEDDYDSEYRFAGRPLAALQGLDDAGRVIYIGTFSKVLFPALRIGYLILPPPLVDAFLTVRSLIDIHAPILEQAALADFMVEGHFTRHLRRMRTLYAGRRAVLLEAVRELPLEIDSPEAGMYCIGWLPDGMDDVSVVRQAAAQGLDLTPVSRFSMEPLARKGLVLGYAAYSVQQIQDAVRRLAAALRSV